jgi:predicted ATPase
VLDNFDRLSEHAVATVGLWMREAPSSRFLVTSRVPLDLVGEQTWSLSPLSRDEAIELFTRRALEVQPRLAMGNARDVVGEIVDAIDRMPLAIELAATRLSILTPAQLRGRLDKPLELLAARREVSRHASMRRAVLDSVELLPPDAQRLFAACAILRNGFTLEAAEDVMGGTITPRERVIDGLETLARNSLLRVDVEGDDVARYALFEMIREVADERFASEGAASTLRGKHASFYAAWCARGEAQPTHAVAREIENLLVAHGTSVALAKSERSAARALEAVTMTRTLEPLLPARGQSGLLVRLCDDALIALDAVPHGHDVARSETLLARGLGHRELGESARAKSDFERALALANDAKDPMLAATALARLGEMSDVAGDTDVARARFVEALRLLDATAANSTRTSKEAEVYLRLAHAHRREGALGEARDAATRSVERYRALAHNEGIALALYELAIIEMFASERETAFAHFDEGLRIARHGDARVATGALLTARGCLLQELGRLDEALEHHAEAARIFHDVGSRYREASALYYLATSYLERGEADEAVAILRRARARLEGVGATRYDALVAGCLAVALAIGGKTGDAAAAMRVAEQSVAAVRNEPALACNVRIHRLTVDALTSGEPPSSVDASALERESPSDDSRFAFRVHERARTHAPKQDDDHALLVWADGSAFRLPRASAPTALPEGSPLRRILRAFALRRTESPGEVVSIDEVIRAGWPDERIGADAAINRAHVALTALRKLGLRGILVHGAGGYVLSQAILVRLINTD